MSEVFEYARRVAFAETDMAGIVHFTSVLRWVEEAEAAWRRSKGEYLCRRDPDGTLTGWPKVGVTADYFSPARFEDEVVVALSVDADGRTSRRWKFDIRNKADGNPVARGTLTVVHVSISPSGDVTKLPVV